MASGAKIDKPDVFEEWASTVEGGAAMIVFASALRISQRARVKMAQPKHGRTYRIGTVKRYVKKGGKRWNDLRAMGARAGTNSKGKDYLSVGAKLHRASAPGEAPAVDTGNLTNSVEVRMTGKTTAEITFTAEYAAALEFGGAHVAPRPFLGPSVQEESAGLFAALGELIE